VTAADTVAAPSWSQDLARRLGGPGQRVWPGHGAGRQRGGQAPADHEAARPHDPLLRRLDEPLRPLLVTLSDGGGCRARKQGRFQLQGPQPAVAPLRRLAGPGRAVRAPRETDRKASTSLAWLLKDPDKARAAGRREPCRRRKPPLAGRGAARHAQKAG